MNLETEARRRANVPPIIPIVLRQIARLRAAGEVTAETFDSQIERLATEDLEPRGLTLLVRGLSDGRTRFLIKTKSGEVREMIECGGTCLHQPGIEMEEGGAPLFGPRRA